jgi:transcriptional regulator with XRE-family HTH domain
MDTMKPDLLNELLRTGTALPEEWRCWPPDRCFQYLRGRLEFTQDELAMKSGVAQSQISRLEGGSDALLETWRRVYSAMGFELILVPVSPLTIPELERKAAEGRPADHWRRQRARPRRLKLAEK